MILRSSQKHTIFTIASALISSNQPSNNFQYIPKLLLTNNTNNNHHSYCYTSLYRFSTSSQQGFSSKSKSSSSSSNPNDQHKYKLKTTKQIQQEIGQQKWKQLQNTFKSLNTSFGLKKPTLQQLSSSSSNTNNNNNTNNKMTNKFSTPTKIQYSLQSLRQCSQQYPIYLYHELQKNNSSFVQVINKVIDNLWKADQKQTLEFLEFLYAWDYDKIDLLKLHQAIINRFELSLPQLFTFLKRFNGKLYKQIQLKILQLISQQKISSNQYGYLLKIINFFTVKQLLSQSFYTSICYVVKNNINRIPPSQALQAYVYYTYNVGGELMDLKKQKQEKEKQKQKEKEKYIYKQGKNEAQKLNVKQNQQNKDKNDQKACQTSKDSNKNNEDLGLNIIKIIQKRILSQQCIKFYNGEQLVALLYSFLKNNLLLRDETNSQQYQSKLSKIVSRIELGYYAKDFSTRDKQKLLQMSGLLPSIKKLSIIALVQNELLKKSTSSKFDYKLMPYLYLISYQNSLLTAQLKQKLQNGILQNLFLIDKKDISRVVWLFTLTNSQLLNSLHKKTQTILQGGLNSFKIQDICVIVWSMCSANFNQEGKFWGNVQAYIYEELQRVKLANQKKKNKVNSNSTNEKQKINKQHKKIEKLQSQDKQDAITKSNDTQRLVNECSWILWAYHNNRQLHIQTISLISQIILQHCLPSSSSSSSLSSSSSNINNSHLHPLSLEHKLKPQPQQQYQQQTQQLLSVFQLSNVISFYYSINLPKEMTAIQKNIKDICVREFKNIYRTMEPIQLCKCLKYIGAQIWGKRVTQNVKQVRKQKSDKKQASESKNMNMNQNKNKNETKSASYQNEQIVSNILTIFQISLQQIQYRDIMTVIGILISSNIKTKRVVVLITKLMERKKRLQALENIGSQVSNNQNSKDGNRGNKWKFPI